MDSGIVTTAPRTRRARGLECRVVHSWEQEEWLEVLMRVARHDSYHLPEYQRVEEFRLGAAAHGPFLIARPLMLRPTEEVLGRWHDATSAYGYGAPIASRDDLPSSFVSKAGKHRVDD